MSTETDSFSNSSEEEDDFSIPPIEWQSKYLVFYLLYNKPLSYIIRLPDGGYIEVKWGKKWRVNRTTYNQIMLVTNNLKKNLDKGETLAYDGLSNLSDQGNILDIIIPISTGPIYPDDIFDNFDNITNMVSPNYLIKSIKNRIYKDLFNKFPPDVFRGKTGIWAKSKPPISFEGIYLTGLYNKKGVLIL